MYAVFFKGLLIHAIFVSLCAAGLPAFFVHTHCSFEWMHHVLIHQPVCIHLVGFGLSCFVVALCVL